jgi:hypothetical protein
MTQNRLPTETGADAAIETEEKNAMKGWELPPEPNNKHGFEVKLQTLAQARLLHLAIIAKLNETGLVTLVVDQNLFENAPLHPPHEHQRLVGQFGIEEVEDTTGKVSMRFIDRRGEMPEDLKDATRNAIREVLGKAQPENPAKLIQLENIQF